MTSEPRRPIAVLIVLCVLSAVEGCGGSGASSDTELRARRADLAQVAHALLAARQAVATEVVAARVSWPRVDHGIPGPVPAAPTTHGHTSGHSPSARRDAALRSRRRAALAIRLAAIAAAVDVAAAGGQQLPVALVPHAEELTGAGAGIAGVYGLAAGLVAHGWRYVQATLAAARGNSRAQAFLRANVNTYIISAYDGNFDLALLGKMLTRAYKRLGGAKAFHGTLTPGEVAEVAAAYSPAVEQLHPHPWQGLVAQP